MLTINPNVISSNTDTLEEINMFQSHQTKLYLQLIISNLVTQFPFHYENLHLSTNSMFPIIKKHLHNSFELQTYKCKVFIGICTIYLSA